MSRLVSTTRGIGRLEQDGETVALLDLSRPDIKDLGGALREGLDVTSIAAAPVRERVPTAQAQLRAPIPRPPKIWAVGFAYADHRSEVGQARNAGGEPFIFLKAPSSVIGSGQSIRLPRVASDQVDYEGELAVVIGRRATDITPSQARAVIAGYTICNDVSARDVQKGRIPGRAANVSAAKSFDTFTPLGPSLVTLDEFADPDDLDLRTWVDGELRQKARTGQLLYPVPELVAYLSRQTTLEPGDVIATGTPAGVGHPSGRFLRPGSEVRIEIEGCGVLRNTCI
ncbi:fumarylacetoacetate hydrolase family protein [Pseudonocardia dioxanivorans]|uniref:fumarylacetoacetate hydrolase family protein n=1 Tax=Pseudonocardia dioxanivorans TaxID=240495 RepID=UPI000CD32E8B|nr:fumarylacetoacetate hydrolase family protein [Pseudonocardia dioxanivorans]